MKSKLNRVCSAFCQRPRKRSSLYWNECFGVHIKWSLSKPGLCCSFLSWGIRQPHLGGTNSTYHLPNTYKYQFLLLKDNDLTSTHLIFKIHIAARIIFHMFIWENSDKGHPFPSSFIALESLISPDENQFFQWQKKVIKYVQFIATLSHCQPSK